MPQVIPENVELLHDIVMGSGGNRPLHAEVAKPKRPSSKSMTAVILIHGSGADYKDSKMYLFLAAHGYFAASIEYRLKKEARWPACLEDCKLAVRWLRANAASYDVDPSRIACEGASIGGYLANCLGTMGDQVQFEGKGGYLGTSSIGKGRKRRIIGVLERKACLSDQLDPPSKPGKLLQLNSVRCRLLAVRRRRHLKR